MNDYSKMVSLMTKDKSQVRIHDSRRRGRQPSNGERQHTNSPNFVKRLHEIENIFGHGSVLGAPP